MYPKMEEIFKLFCKQIDDILTDDLRERSNNGKYSKFLVYASSERVAWHLLLGKSFVDLSTDEMCDWAMKHLPSQGISVQPDVPFTENQKEIYREIAGDIMTGCYENSEHSDGEEEERPDYSHPEKVLFRYGISESRVIENLQWCKKHIQSESTVYGLMWSFEMLTWHHSWDKWQRKAPTRDTRCLDTMAGLIRFYKGDKYAEFLIGGQFVDLRDSTWRA